MNRKASLGALRRALALAGLLMLTSTRVAEASEVDTFEHLMDEGHRMFDRGDYTGAAQKFQAARPLLPCPTAGLWLGKSLERLERRGEAFESYRTVSETTLPAGAAEPCKKAISESLILLQALEQNLGFVQLQVERGSNCQNSGACSAIEVRIGERIREWTPLPAGSTWREISKPIALEPGSWVISVSADGRSAHNEVRVAAKQTVVSDFDLTPPPPLPPPAPPPPRAKSPPSRSLLPVVVIGVGAAAIATGAVTGALALGKSKSAEDDCNDSAQWCTTAGKEAAASAQTLGTVSTVSFGVGVAAVAGGVALWLLETPKAKSARDTRWLRDAARNATWAPLLAISPTAAFAGAKAAW